MIKTFQNNAAREAAGYPTDESRVSLILGTREVVIDGVNVLVDAPTTGDAVYHDGTNYYFFKGGEALNHSNLTSLGFTYFGDVLRTEGNYAVIVDKNTGTSLKFLDVCQYAITTIASTSITINLRFKNSADSNTAVNVSLTSAEINATSAAEISAAVQAAATTDGDTRDWWAYLADADGNKVDSDGTQIIIQCDTCDYWQFYVVSGTGCTIKLYSWRDMPSSDSYFKSNGYKTNYRGMLNIARASTYWSTNGRSTSETYDVWHGNIGTNTNPLTKNAFLGTTMYGNGYHQYPTYENYLRGEFGIRWPQKYGVFSLPNGEYLTEKYGNMMAPTKNGGTKYMYPALHKPLTINYNNIQGISEGDWYLCDVNDGISLFNDENMAKININRRKTGSSVVNNSSYRWFAQRYNVYNAWIFRGNSGALYNSNVNSSFLVQAVTLLPIKK